MSSALEWSARRALLVSLVIGAGCSRSALAVDEHVSDADTDAGRDAGSGACVEPFRPPHPWCRLDTPNASVRGQTPLGDVDLSFAWASYIEACADHLVLGPDGTLHGEPLAQPTLPSLHVGPLPPVGMFEEVPVTVRFPGCRAASTTGLLEVIENPGVPGDDPRGAPGRPDGFCTCDPTHSTECEVTGEVRRVVARLRVTSAGWDLEGEIRAPQCHALHGICF